MERSVMDTIRNIEEIPTLPMVAMEVMTLSKTPNVSIKAISECIHKDPPLAAKVLKLANSAFYRRGNQEIDTLHRAILLMGLNEIINITTTVSVLSIMGIKDKKSESLRIKLWDHSVATGLIARHIDKKIMLKAQGREFVGGLLHDIGKIILDEFFHDRFMRPMRCPSRGAATCMRPSRSARTTHMEVGHFLADKWGCRPTWRTSPAPPQPLPGAAQGHNLSHLHRESSRQGEGALVRRRHGVLRAQGPGGMAHPAEEGIPRGCVDVERITFEMEDIGKEVKSYISTLSEESDGETVNG
jgi:hypothetical protein